MKKAFPHILFWLGYWALLEYAEFLWMKNYIPEWTASKMIGRSVIASFLYGLSHLSFAYYLTYFALPKIVKNRSAALLNISMILLPYMASICAIIFLAHHFVLPIVYEGIVAPAKAFFDPQKFFSLMIEVAFPAGLLLAFRLVNTQLAAKQREKDLLQTQLSTELRLLKSQLNPHFLFNTLNNIYALSRKKSDLTPEVVLKLSELLSFLLYEAGNDTIPIEKEVKFLEDYIDLQKIRFNDGLSVVFNKNIDQASDPIAPLLLLPLVENAFKHGASENHFDSFINIDLKLQKGDMHFKIENSFEKNGHHHNAGNIGLSNTTRQLELMYRQQKMEIDRKENVFSISLSVNLNSYGKM
ncbi:MAG: histidine kinase [Chitinophagaceae bacterium]|nr:histidine kinase [Chitinophagaceae bacterium]